MANERPECTTRQGVNAELGLASSQKELQGWMVQEMQKITWMRYTEVPWDLEEGTSDFATPMASLG